MQGVVDQSHLKFTPTQTGDTTCVQCRGEGNNDVKFTPSLLAPREYQLNYTAGTQLSQRWTQTCADPPTNTMLQHL